MELHPIICQLENKSYQERQQLLQELLEKLELPYTLQKVPHKELEGYNIIIGLSGSEPKRLVIGAHYDPFPGAGGANDNGSGVSIVLALAKHFWDEKPDYSIDFIFFVWEERGHLGSKVFVENSDPSTILGMINLDMCGTGDMIVFDHKGDPRKLLPKTCLQACQSLTLPHKALKRIPPGDDLQFENVGIPTISIAITPTNLSGFVGRLAQTIHPATPTWKKLLFLPTILPCLIRKPPLIAVMHKSTDTGDLVTEEALQTVYILVEHLINALSL